jgi:hypothetical protein
MIIGLFTRLAAIPHHYGRGTGLNQLPILLGHDVWIFQPVGDIGRTGFWNMMHKARDARSARGCIYPAVGGAGSWSVDERMKE